MRRRTASARTAKVIANALDARLMRILRRKSGERLRTRQGAPNMAKRHAVAPRGPRMQVSATPLHCDTTLSQYAPHCWVGTRSGSKRRENQARPPCVAADSGQAGPPGCTEPGTRRFGRGGRSSAQTGPARWRRRPWRTRTFRALSPDVKARARRCVGTKRRRSDLECRYYERGRGRVFRTRWERCHTPCDSADGIR